MADKRKRNSYIAAIDAVLIKLAVGCIAMLMIVQFFFLPDGFPKYLSKVDRLEGESVTSDRTVVDNLPIIRKKRMITIRLIRPAANRDVVVIVNGKNAGNFELGRVSLDVYEGDYVEIDAREIKEPAQFVVDVPNTEFVSPINGLVLETRGSIATVGKIIFRQ